MTATAQRQGPPEEYIGQELSLVEHLDELRSRLFKAALAAAIGLAVGWLFREQVLELLKQPYCELPPNLREGTQNLTDQECALVITSVLGGFFINLKAAAMVAVVLAAPVVFYQLLRFITPGLTNVERRYAIPFVVVSQVLFVGGAVFSYFVIPRALEFLLAFSAEEFVPLLDANDYFGFVLKTMLAFGISFEFPLILCILALMGVVSSGGLRRVRRYAIFGIFVAAAIITPTQDPITMTLMAGPLALFYEISIVFARLVERRRERTALTLGS